MPALVTYMTVMLLSGLAAAILVLQLVPDRDQIRATLQSGRRFAAPGDKPALFRMLQLPILLTLPFLAGMGPAPYRDKKREQLERAGLDDGLSVDEILGMKVVLAAILGGVTLLYQLPLVLFLFAAVFGFLFPDLWLHDRAKARHKEILQQLPFALDLLVLLVEAGLDFTAAIAQCVERMNPGPLRDEFDRMLKDFRLGASRIEALRSLSRRVGLKEVTTFTAALIQATELGSSIGKTLRQQSEIMRTHRFQEAERQGGAASQKMVIPLVLFILPAVFIVLFGPSLVRYIYGVM